VKGVEAVVDCPVTDYAYKSLADLKDLSLKILAELGLKAEVALDSNENIGTTHMLYRFRGVVGEGSYIGVRVVTRSGRVLRVLLTLPSTKLVENRSFAAYNPEPDLAGSSHGSSEAPGQYYIPNFVIYAILGYPRSLDVSSWKLEVAGLVDNSLSLSLKDLYELGIEAIKIDFHCVTGWSVRGVEFAGPSFTKIAELARLHETAEWVYVESLDGYTAVVPLEEVLKPGVLVALEMNGKPLEPEHGYPARLLIPHLYGWKSVKWIRRIVFTDKYTDGYWEALGYHPRGRVDLEERFKKY